MPRFYIILFNLIQNTIMKRIKIQILLLMVPFFGASCTSFMKDIASGIDKSAKQMNLDYWENNWGWSPEKGWLREYNSYSMGMYFNDGEYHGKRTFKANREIYIETRKTSIEGRPFELHLFCDMTKNQLNGNVAHITVNFYLKDSFVEFDRKYTVEESSASESGLSEGAYYLNIGFGQVHRGWILFEGEGRRIDRILFEMDSEGNDGTQLVVRDGFVKLNKEIKEGVVIGGYGP